MSVKQGVKAPSSFLKSSVTDLSMAVERVKIGKRYSTASFCSILVERALRCALFIGRGPQDSGIV